VKDRGKRRKKGEKKTDGEDEEEVERRLAKVYARFASGRSSCRWSRARRIRRIVTVREGRWEDKPWRRSLLV